MCDLDFSPIVFSELISHNLSSTFVGVKLLYLLLKVDFENNSQPFLSLPSLSQSYVLGCQAHRSIQKITTSFPHPSLTLPTQESLLNRKSINNTYLWCSDLSFFFFSFSLLFFLSLRASLSLSLFLLFYVCVSLSPSFLPCLFLSLSRCVCMPVFSPSCLVCLSLSLSV